MKLVGWLVFALLLCGAPALASDAIEKQAAALARMKAGVEKQEASVQRQAGSGFFVLRWGPGQALRPAVFRPQPVGDCEALADIELRPIIAQASTEFGVDPAVIRAVIAQESGARPCVVSPKGAQGMMQLMPATQADLGISNPFDAAENVRAGTRYLKQLLERYDNKLPLALAAYNAGMARVETSIPDIPETQDYVAAIMAELQKSNVQ